MSSVHVVLWLKEVTGLRGMLLYHRAGSSMGSRLVRTHGEVIPTIADIMLAYPHGSTYELLEMRND